MSNNEGASARSEVTRNDDFPLSRGEPGRFGSWVWASTCIFFFRVGGYDLSYEGLLPRVGV